MDSLGKGFVHNAYGLFPQGRQRSRDRWERRREAEGRGRRENYTLCMTSFCLYPLTF